MMGASWLSLRREAFLLLGGLLAVLSSCGQGPAAPATALPLNSAIAAGGSLPALPDDGPWKPRQVSAVNTYDGVERLLDSGAGISPNPNNGWWLQLDASASSRAVWALYRFAASPDGPFQQFDFSVSANVPYYIAYADYSLGRWVYYKLAQHPQGLSISESIIPASLPNGEAALHSPGGYAYFAVIAAPGNTEVLQLRSISVTTPTVVDPGEDPIPDQFENNDTLDTATLLTAGSYTASIHQSYVAGMLDPNERRDYTDCYSIVVPAGMTLTATLRHDVWNFFGKGNYNDADLLFYQPSASDVDSFDEDLSSYGIYYDPFEQVLVTNSSGTDQTMRLAVVGDRGEPGAPTDAVYSLGLHVSPAVWQVSGSITQLGSTLDKDVVVFLEPGNFNAATPVPGNGTPGQFSIQGVPPGDYTLRVHGSARFGPDNYVWPESLPVTVAGNVSGLSLDLGADPL